MPETISFSRALAALKEGSKVAREGWNGKGMWLLLIAADKWQIPNGLEFNGGAQSAYPVLPFIGMKTADGSFVPWLASQTDILADDWSVI
jgi:hypothetical protein